MKTLVCDYSNEIQYFDQALFIIKIWRVLFTDKAVWFSEDSHVCTIPLLFWTGTAQQWKSQVICQWLSLTVQRHICRTVHVQRHYLQWLVPALELDITKMKKLRIKNSLEVILLVIWGKHFTFTLSTQLYIWLTAKCLAYSPRYSVTKTEPFGNAIQSGGICKRSFIPTVWPTVHTKPSRKRSSPKTLFKPEVFENAGFWVFISHFENGAFGKRFTHDYRLISLTTFSSNTNPTWWVLVAFLDFSGVV